MNTQLRLQQTLATSCSVQGFGYWSGEDVRVEFHPAPANTGIVFARSDQPSAPPIPAQARYRIETPRRTTLRHQSATVEMIEHIMAALAGLRIDNCRVLVDRAEMPGCDGSSQQFVEALDQAGIVPLEVHRPQLWVRETLRVGSDEAWVEARPSRAGDLLLRYRLDYGLASPIGRQQLSVRLNPATFRRELASARTFLLAEEAAWLRQQGLGARVTSGDVLVFGPDGPVDNTLRFDDECVRHKTLDLVGDLALAGCDLVGEFVAYRSGHRLNVEMVKALLAEGCRVEQTRRIA